jgi:hypothetical protein
MNTMQIASKNVPFFIVFSLLGRHFQKSCVALFTLVVLMAALLAGTAVAEQGFALIGTWEHKGKATREITVDTSTVVFKPDGTFTTTWTVVPSPGQRDLAPGVSTWRGTYRATGKSSWVATVKSYQNCEKKTGSCNSCPRQRGDGRGYKNACANAKKVGLPVGVPKKNSVQMQGPDTYVTDSGDTFRRVR